MSYIQGVLGNAKVRSMTLAAFQDEKALGPALEAIYKEGFRDTPQMDGAEKVFAERVKVVGAEYRAQLEQLLADFGAWEAKQLSLAEDPDATLKSLLQHNSSKASVLQRSAFFMGPRSDLSSSSAA